MPPEYVPRRGHFVMENYLIFQLLPHSWQIAVFVCLNFVFDVPLDFFHTRFDVPIVIKAVAVRRALLVWPPNPVPWWPVRPLV